MTAPGHSPAAAEELMLGKEASAENLDVLVLIAGSLSPRGNGEHRR